MTKPAILLSILLLLQSCASSMYIAPTRSIPLLEKKGEIHGEAGTSTNSLYANTSYAITDDIAVSLNGSLSYGNFSDKYDLVTNNSHDLLSVTYFSGKFEHRYGEISVGKINMPIIPSIKSELFGGVGIGRATDGSLLNDNYKSDYYSLFGQINFGFKRQIFELGWSVRLAYSGFDYTANMYSTKDGHVPYKNNFNVLHAEPMMFAAIGSKNLKLVYRYGINIAYTINPKKELAGYYGFDRYDGVFEHTIFHLSLGISYRFKGK